MYCENQARYPGKSWDELFPNEVFPSDSPDDATKSEIMILSGSACKIIQVSLYQLIYGWLAGSLAGWLVGSLAGWFAGWLCVHVKLQRFLHFFDSLEKEQ